MIHPTAIVESESVGEGTNVWAYAHVMQGATVGAGCNVGDHAFIEGGASVGDNVTVKNAVCIWEGVTIESNVFIGPNVTFTNDLHPRSPRMPAAHQRYAEDGWLAETVVREGCSIGAAAVICPGITLGEYCMVAAGAVVSKNVPPFALVVGVPARKVADVCVCGQRLPGDFDKVDCNSCGQSASNRIQLLTISNCNVKE